MRNYLEEMLERIESIDRKVDFLLKKNKGTFSLREVSVKTGLSTYKIKRLYAQGLLKLSRPPWKIDNQLPRMSLRDIEIIEAYKNMDK